MPDDAYARELPVDIRQARTGVPVVDEAVRTLYSTGTLHNHARMWLASYVVHLRHVHWRAGADWMVAHLLDGDLASNHLSWQWVAGTGSHKPYLFNAENVARYAPPHWHSPGTVVDRSYEALDRLAREARSGYARHTAHDAGDLRRIVGGRDGASRGEKTASPGPPAGAEAPGGTDEPPLWHSPPAGLGLTTPVTTDAEAMKGRHVWLVHPWALRPPPSGLPESTAVIGLYLREHHQTWPWPEARWRWVDAAMADVASRRWWVGSGDLQHALQGAASVHCMDDPHLHAWLPRLARCAPAPRLFPPVERPCSSFSQWWTGATRGRRQAQELLTDGA